MRLPLLNMSRESQMKALIRLVEDPDEIVFAHVRDKLLDYGADAIPFLEISWEDEELGILFQKRIEDIIHDIQFEESKRGLTEWVRSEEKDLLEGSLAIARFQYPGLDEEAIRADIAKITQDIWLEINQKSTILEKVRIFNKVFFGTHGFRGNTDNYHSPLNSYLNTVLEMRRGNPLSLSLVYSLVANRLQLPIHGVNLPHHFILAYVDEENLAKYQDKASAHGVLFYINPFSKGSLFDEDDIRAFLDKYKLPYDREYFEPCSNTQMLRRMLTNLIASFQEVGNAQKVNELKEMRDILDV